MRSRCCSPKTCSAQSNFSDLCYRHPGESAEACQEALMSIKGKMAAAVASDFILDRCDAVPALVGRHEDFLIVSGLAGTSRDVAALTEDGVHAYTMAGAMGGACMIGLGLALARRDRRVLVGTRERALLVHVG